MVSPWLRTHPRTAILFALCSGVFLLGYISFRDHSTGILTVAFLNVGQGDAVYIEGPTGTQILYDAGPPDRAVLTSLTRVMPLFDRSLDAAMMSHPDQDHIGGFPEIFHRYKVAALIEPGVGSDNGIYARVESDVIAEHATHYVARRGMQIDLGGGAGIDVLYPDHDPSRMETNSASIVLRVAYGQTCVLLTGDLPSSIEEYLVRTDPLSLDCDVLKLGHHGSRTSSSPSFLAAVSPSVAVISSGKGNTYGHPHKEVLDRLTQLGIPFVRTDEKGTIIVESDGKHISLRP